MKKQNLQKVTRVDNGTLEQTLLTMEDAIQKLNGYWKQETIETRLLDGAVLHTPYASYFISVNHNKNQTNKMKQQQLPKGQQTLIKEAIERMLKPTADPLTEQESFDLLALRGMFSEPNDVTISINDDSKAFREKALAFAIDSTRIESMYKDFKELNTSIDSYLDSLVMIPELMCDSFYMCVYDSHHDAIRIEMDNIDKAIYISRDSVSKELVVEYHWGSADIDWGVLYNDDSFFKQMWSEFIWCNPIKEYKTIKDYHVELFFRICYVSDLHSSLYSYNK